MSSSLEEDAEIQPLEECLDREAVDDLRQFGISQGGFIGTVDDSVSVQIGPFDITRGDIGECGLRKIRPQMSLTGIIFSRTALPGI